MYTPVSYTHLDVYKRQRKWDTNASLAAIWKQLKGQPSITLETLPARSNASSLKVNDKGVITPCAAHQARRPKAGLQINILMSMEHVHTRT